ncbi:hypothetical protein ABT084_00475 [Streptomyces sp. NPDC002138]|uniref:hypothetical protein n=1 Tax=Streptomyces sp. NPDC002138 TaxID=3154410 RepID=UPI00331A9CF0
MCEETRKAADSAPRKHLLVLVCLAMVVWGVFPVDDLMTMVATALVDVVLQALLAKPEGGDRA